MKILISILQRREKYLQTKYGLSLEEFNSMLEAQGFVCAICHKSPGDKNLCVDHNHKTGAIRGLLCSKCNYKLGIMHDDLEFMREAYKYLENHI
jgi:hypothetical protein